MTRHAGEFLFRKKKPDRYKIKQLKTGT